MRHFRSIVLIIAVLLQALPGAVGLRAMGMAAEATPKCEMDCCAWVQQVEQEENTCACAPATEQQQPTAPPTIPSQSARDVIPVVYWKAQEDILQPAAPISEPQSSFVTTDASEKATPHVRLSVLFCAILI
ncbi:hypothetical protein DES53_10422 [Roseimicrobium gellanilyticum]|uniref:Uncharacterized protein n=1 Tax=Roseimicrobium gellanilyticum TaxID=748857 RepID=A0A366HM89_9BACT|nr:hypothetical protein [Roseimicrobium gellanilyticum]RBP44203.1 hypothetical protein DES53_10422 [Roseimicrobium gellanilyticum]